VTQDSIIKNADSLGLNFKNLARIKCSAEHIVPLQKKLVLLRQLALAYMSTKDPYKANAFQVGGIEDNVVNQVKFAGLNESEIKTAGIISAMAGVQWKFLASIYLTGRVNPGFYDFNKSGS
jgi:hypothetical protein